MPITKASLETKIKAELESAGIVTTGEHAKALAIATAIANAVVDEIQTNALVVVSGGSSSGSYKVT